MCRGHRSRCGGAARRAGEGAFRHLASGDVSGRLPGADPFLGPARPLVAGGRIRQGAPGRWPHREGLDSPDSVGDPGGERSGVYSAFLRGVFEADGTVLYGVPSVSTSTESFAAEIRTLLLAIGLATTTRTTVSGWGGPICQIRLRNVDHALNFSDSSASSASARRACPPHWNRALRQQGHLFLPDEAWAELVPVGHSSSGRRQLSRRKHGGSRAVGQEDLRGDP